MQAIFLSLALILCGADAALESFVEQSVDTIAVVHVKDGAEMIFFFAFVQNEWSCLDHRRITSDVAVHRVGDEWILTWRDDGDGCYRVVRARHWLESWEDQSPLAAENGKPWFQRLCAPGLAQPRRAEP